MSTYRLKRQTIATHVQDNRRIVVMLPAETILVLAADLPADNDPVACDWHGKTISLRADAIRERGERLLPRACGA